MSQHSEIWTQGTQLYVLGEDESSKKVVFEVEGVTDLSTGEASKNEIPITTLKDKAKRTMNGLLDSGTASIKINLKNGDKGHRLLEHFYKTDQNVKFAIGLDDGYGENATLSENDFTLPKTRTWYLFEGSIKSFPPEISPDSAVAININVQVSGEGKFVWPESVIRVLSEPTKK